MLLQARFRCSETTACAHTEIAVCFFVHEYLKRVALAASLNHLPGLPITFGKGLLCLNRLGLPGPGFKFQMQVSIAETHGTHQPLPLERDIAFRVVVTKGDLPPL